MQTKARFNPLSLIRRFQLWMARPLDKTQVKPRDTDIPDYLRDDVGLLPHHRKQAQRSGDPPMRDPFRLM